MCLICIIVNIPSRNYINIQRPPQGTEDKKLTSQIQNEKFVKFQYTINYNKNNACKCLAISLSPRKMHTFQTLPIHFYT